VSTVPKASSPRSARARAFDVVEQPGDLGGAEVRIDDQARPLAHQALGARFLQLAAGRCRAPVLPDDGVGDRLAALAVPEERGLALVGDADRHHAFQRHPGALERAARHRALRGENLLGIVLDPAGLRVDLRELLLRDAHQRAVLVEDDGARARGALVERKNGAHAAILLTRSDRQAA
jgi:hypothetical protein